MENVLALHLVQGDGGAGDKRSVVTVCEGSVARAG